jgi:hypothetical protein
MEGLRAGRRRLVASSALGPHRLHTFATCDLSEPPRNPSISGIFFFFKHFLVDSLNLQYSLCFRSQSRGTVAKRGGVVEHKAPVRRGRLGAHGLMFRRRRIFARLREGFTYEEIAAEEGVPVTHDDGARKKLIVKVNRLADFGIDEDFAAAVREHLRKTRGLPDGWGEADVEGADLAGSPEFMGEANAPEARSGFFYSKRP